MSLISEFNTRKVEVQKYLKVIKLIERTTDEKILKRYDHEARIFRAGALLVMYNLIEASARSGIQAIYDELKMQSVSYEKLHSGFRKRILGDFKKNAGTSKDHLMSNVAVEMIEKSFKADKLFSGNVDAREIRKLANTFGFEAKTDFNSTLDGEKLLTVKSKRNDLAHGVVTFSEAAKDFTLHDISEISKYSLAYMEQILKNIEKYLEEKAYLEANSAA